jgi:hypothetical protein
MSRKRLDISVGDRFGRLVIVSELPLRIRPAGGSSRVFLCLCDCGVSKEAELSNLRSGSAKSCGCHRRRKPLLVEVKKSEKPSEPNLKSLPEYVVWKGIKRRCFNGKHREYANYGGRGIVVCDRWKTSFKAFYEDMGQRPSSEHQIERIDNNGNYEPGNCRWATRAEQNRNRRNNVWLEFDGERLCLKDMAEKYGMTKAILGSRLRAGWTLRDALLTPVRHWSTDRKFMSTLESARNHEWMREKRRREKRLGHALSDL